MKFFKMLFALIFFSVAFNYIALADEEVMEELKGRVEGIDERLTEAQNDLSGLKKIKLSGYMQIQYEKTENAKGLTTSPYDANDIIQNRFRVRRSRLKVTYDAGLTQYVLQGDYSNSGFSLKDAYIKITEPWTKWTSLTVGVFNRPNYEVEYSSSQRESMERSTVIATLYPGERDLGAMITFKPEEMFKLQIAAFNNTYQGTFRQNNPVFRDENLYYMFRATKELNIDEGLDLDFGAHFRYGNVRANSKYLIESDLPTNTKAIDSTSITVGSSVPRSWFGVEMQLYWDFLGGMKLLGEFITGNDVNELSLSSVNPKNAIRKRAFSGFYAMLVKNLGTEWQFAAKYDSYNPNTKITDDLINTTSELAINTLGFGIHNYSFPNVRISAWYDMPMTKTNDRILKDDPKDNLFTLRFQYKF